MSEYRPGKNCKCNAWAAFECACDNVDWRSKREVELEAENAKLREAIGQPVGLKICDQCGVGDRKPCCPGCPVLLQSQITVLEAKLTHQRECTLKARQGEDELYAENQRLREAAIKADRKARVAGKASITADLRAVMEKKEVSDE